MKKLFMINKMVIWMGSNSCMFVVFLLCLFSCQSHVSLVPPEPSGAPDYFSTWKIQGYVVNYPDAESRRAQVNEQSIFGNGKYENWINFFPAIRNDLYFVIDDSWDIPQDVNNENNEYRGLAELDLSRFPSFKGNPEERLKSLSNQVKSFGWKGLGGWVSSQESSLDEYAHSPEMYWTKKLKAMDYAGVRYWKIAWGDHAHDGEWRKMVSNLGRTHAPELFIEHVIVNDYVEFSDVFRTSDVEPVIAVPITIQRVVELLTYQAEENAKGIINCEDEPYIAAGLGCAIGVMRYPFEGNLPNGRQDFNLPPVGRNLKKRMDEVVRAVRWHRIAEPFGVANDMQVDTRVLTDYWTFEEEETWIGRSAGDVVAAEAPGRVSRNMPLPMISNLYQREQPYVLASRYPNGAVAIATIERVLDRHCVLKPEVVSMQLTDLFAPVGIFGDYEELNLLYSQPVDKNKIKIYAQDLAGDVPVEITKKVEIKDNKIIIPGSLIRKVGLMKASRGDLSAPGMVLQIFPR